MVEENNLENVFQAYRVGLTLNLENVLGNHPFAMKHILEHDRLHALNTPNLWRTKGVQDIDLVNKENFDDGVKKVHILRDVIKM